MKATKDKEQNQRGKEFLPENQQEQSPTTIKSSAPPQLAIEASKPEPQEEVIQTKEKEPFQLQFAGDDDNTDGTPPNNNQPTAYSLSKHIQTKSKTNSRQIQPYKLPALQKKDDTESPVPSTEEQAKTQWIVEDKEDVLVVGQLPKAIFFNKLKLAITTKAEAALSSTDWTAAGCPIIDKWIAWYSKKSAEELEKDAQKFGVSPQNAASAKDYIEHIANKSAAAISTWVRTGKLSGIPISNLEPPVQEDIQQAKDHGVIQQKEEKGQSRQNNQDPQQVQDQLGEGQTLAGATKTKMEGAFGTSFSDVKIHTDTKAAKLSQDMNAKAFAVGKDIAFGQGEFKPGTMKGDALLAHELAHTQQQQDATSNSDISSNYGALETDADNAAVGAIAKIWGKGKKWMKGLGKEAMPRLKSGLSLQRCGGGPGYSTTKPILENEQHSFGTDDFNINIDWTTIHSNNSNHIAVELDYAGDDMARRPSATFYYDFYKDYGLPNPKVTKKKGTEVLIDLFSDGKFIIKINDKITMNNKWAPASRKHDFEVYGNSKKMGQYSILEVIPKGAIPTKVNESVDKAQGKENPDEITMHNPVEALRQVRIRIKNLKESYSFKSIDGTGWDILLKQIDSDIAMLEKEKGNLTQDKENEYTRKANYLGKLAFENVKILTNLDKLANKKMYLDDIAQVAVSNVHNVQGMFEQALFMAYGNIKLAKAKQKEAEKALIGLPYQISGLYLKRGSGLDELSSQLSQLKTHFNFFKSQNGKSPESTPLEKSLRMADKSVGVKVPEDLHSKKNELRKKFFDNAEGALQEIFELTQDMSQYMGVYSIMTMHEQFIYFDDKIPWLTSDSETRKAVKAYRAKFKGYLNQLEPAIVKRGTKPEAAKAKIKSIVPSFIADINDKKFTELVEQVQTDIKQYEVVKTVGKVLVIVGAAALTAGAAGAAMGAALEGAGIGGLAAFGALTVTEALVFTASSHVMGEIVGMPSETSFGEDLVVNILMFGYMRKAGQYYQKIGAALHKSGHLKMAKMAQMSGSKFVFSLGALQMFAYAHHLVDKGKPMSGAEFGQSLLLNTVLMSALHMGRFITEPLNARIESSVRKHMTKNFGAELGKLELQRVNLKKELTKLQTDKEAAAENLPKALENMRKLTEAEMKLVLKAGKAKGKTGKALQKMVAKYEQKIAEANLKLAQLGVEGKTEGGKSMFEEMGDGIVAYKDNEVAKVQQVLKDFYKEYGGVFLERDGKIMIGKMGGETILYVPKLLASKSGPLVAAIARTKNSAAALEYLKSRLPDDAQKGLEKLKKDEATPEDAIAELMAHQKEGRSIIDYLKNYTNKAKLPALAKGEMANYKAGLETKIKASPKFTQIHSDTQLAQIVQKGKALGLSKTEIQDLLYISCRDAKPIPYKDLMLQMENWVNVVKKRGFPFKFESAEEFANFSTELIKGLKDIKLDGSNVRIQGSSLRTQNANDVDLVVFIGDKEFDTALVIRYSGKITKDGVKIDLIGKSKEELVDLAKDIKNNEKQYNGQGKSFKKAMLERKISAYSKDKIIPGLKKLYKSLAAKYENLNIENISVQTRGGSMDLEPSLKLKSK